MDAHRDHRHEEPSRDLDGFATSNGQDTQLTDDDRVVSSRSIRRSRRRSRTTRKKSSRRKLQRWCAWPICGPTRELGAAHAHVLGQENRSLPSICGQFETYQYATHDDWNYDDWNSKSTSISYVGSRWADRSGIT